MRDATPPTLDKRTATMRIQRIENALVAIAILTAVILSGLPWWVLLAAFVLFDISALGYLRDNRFGAICYNLVHNDSAPAIVKIAITSPVSPTLSCALPNVTPALATISKSLRLSAVTRTPQARIPRTCRR